MRALLLLPTLFLVACGSDAGSSGDLSPRADQTVEVDIEACDVLTASMVAAALGVPETDVTLNQENIDENVRRGYAEEGMFCKYDLPRGSDYGSATLIVSGYESAQGAEAMFSSTYRTQTQEEVAQMEDAGNRAADQLRAEGSEAIEDLDALDGEEADVGGMIAGLASKIAYEDVPGVGDQAAIEINNIVEPREPGAVYVREGSVVYAISLIAVPGHSFDDVYARTIDLGRRAVAGR